jgi:uncharacterized membrane protein
MHRFGFIGILSPLLALAGVVTPAPIEAQTVRAVLFHSPSCGHCRQVISQDLPVFFQVYGGNPSVTEPVPHLALASNGQLEILFVDASWREGGALYEASMASHPVGRDRMGVPRMIVGDSVLVGSYEIPTHLHDIIRKGLAIGGIDWPAIGGLAEVVAGFTPVPAATGVAEEPEQEDGSEVTDSAGAAPVTTGEPGSATPTTGTAAGAADTAGAALPPVESPAEAPRRLQDLGAERTASMGERFARDPVGNGLAVVTLIVMIAVIVAVLAGLPRHTGPREPGLWMPLLLAAGTVVSAYLAFVETTGTLAVCGPVGDCNTVQQSPYATLFGVIPVGLLGLVGYGVMLVLWVLGMVGRPANGLVRRLLFAVTLAGLVFSIYLTFLEPFVIGATCLWCLSSAGIITALTWLSAAWVQRAPAE